MDGFVKVFRKLLDWQWYHDPNTVRVFLHCLLKANYEDRKWKNKIIERGSFVTSLGNLSEQLGLSIQQTRTALSNIQKTGEITIKTTNKYTVIYVQNWANYQTQDYAINTQDNKQITRNSTNEQQTNNHNEEYKEYKEEKNIKEKSISYDIQEKKVSTNRFVKPTIQEIEAYCKSNGFKIDAEHFFHHYEAIGWVCGKAKTPMKSWKSTIVTWTKKQKEYVQQNYQQPKRIIKSSNVQEGDSDDPAFYGAAHVY